MINLPKEGESAKIFLKDEEPNKVSKVRLPPKPCGSCTRKSPAKVEDSK